MSELYSTYTLFTEIEERKIEVPEPVRFRLMQLVLDACTNQKGQWIGGNPFEDLEMLLAITKDNISDARTLLDEPERSEAIVQNLRIHAVFITIRESLIARFREDGRE
jgi:hypothetical protein